MEEMKRPINKNIKCWLRPYNLSQPLVLRYPHFLRNSHEDLLVHASNVVKWVIGLEPAQTPRSTLVHALSAIRRDTRLLMVLAHREVPEHPALTLHTDVLGLATDD